MKGSVIVEGNRFWVLVTELYPIFLQVILVLGLIRIGKGVWQRLSGEEDSINRALSDIVTGFFWAHMAMPLVYAIFRFWASFSDKVTSVFNMIRD